MAFKSSVHLSAPHDDLRSYPDSFVYTSSPLATTSSSRLFKLRLPPGLLRSYASGYDSFGFLYPEKQVIYIYLDRYNRNLHDTSYHAADREEIELLLGELNTINTEDKLNADANPFDSSRSSWISRRGRATILLYNIQKDNLPLFRSFISSFTFL